MKRTASGSLYGCILLFALLTGGALRILAMQVPLSYDEAYTFLNFINRPFSHLLADYHVPNNHVLFTVLSKISMAVFGDTIWSMRLPSLVAGVGLLVLNYHFFSKVADKELAILSTILTATSFSLVYYSGLARGYSIQAFLFMLSFYLVARQRDLPQWCMIVLLSLSVSLTLYTVPTGLYAIGAVFLWGIFLATFYQESGTRKRIVLSLLAALVLAGLLTVIFYGPILHRYQGLPQVQPAKILSVGKVLTKLPETIHEVYFDWADEQHAVYRYLVHFGLLTAIPVFLFRRINGVFLLFVSLAATLVGMLILTRVIPPYQRVWTFLIPFVLAASATGLTGMAHLLPKGWIRTSAVATVGTVLLVTGSMNSYGLAIGKVEKQTGNVNRIYAELKHIAKPGDYVAAPEIIGDRLRFFWYWDGVAVRRIKTGWNCNVFRIVKQGVKSKPFQYESERVLLVTRKGRSKKPFRAWAERFRPEGFELNERELARFGESQILEMTFIESPSHLTEVARL